MKKFYFHDGIVQQGPFDLKELKSKKISKTTPIWYEGLPEWTIADNIDELKELFKIAIPPPYGKKQEPPPFEKETNTPPTHQINDQHQPPQSSVSQKQKKKSRTGILIGIIVGIIAIILVIMVSNNPNSIPGVKLQINTPKPYIVSHRVEDISSLFKAKIKVFGTVQNQGGSGNVFVTFRIFQDGNSYDKSKEIYLGAGESQEVSEEFREVTRLGGDFTYRVEVKSE